MIIINAFMDRQDVASCLKSTYGRCGGASVGYNNGHKIMGVIEYEE